MFKEKEKGQDVWNMGLSNKQKGFQMSQRFFKLLSIYCPVQDFCFVLFICVAFQKKFNQCDGGGGKDILW